MFISSAHVLANASFQGEGRATSPVTAPLGAEFATSLLSSPKSEDVVGTFRPTSLLAQIAHELVGAGEEEFETLKVSLRRHEIDHVRAFAHNHHAKGVWRGDLPPLPMILFPPGSG